MRRTISFLLGLLIVLQISASGRQDVTADTVACTGGRSAVGIVTQVATSAALNLAVTEVLKHNIHEMRPNGADNHSWPSRHTSWAFMAASSFSAEMYRHSGWWVVGAHTAANVMAMERCFSENHFPKDVLGGAAVGLTSTAAGILINRLIFHERFSGCESARYRFGRSLDAVTRAVFYPAQRIDGASLRTGIVSMLRVGVPFSERWGIAGAVAVESAPMYTAGKYLSMRKAAGLSAGVAYNVLDCRNYGIEGRAMTGVLRNFGMEGLSRSDWSYTMDFSVTGLYSLTNDFSLGCEFSYGFYTNRSVVSYLTAGLVTRVNF